MILMGCKPRPGPASKTYYSLPSNLGHQHSEAGMPPELRSELSLAYSFVHFLRPHAIILSLLEGRPLESYRDQASITLASNVYTLPNSPQLDLERTKAEVRDIWRRYYRDQSAQASHTPTAN